MSNSCKGLHIKLALLSVLFISGITLAQKPFYGSLKYTVQPEDAKGEKIGVPYEVELFTNDTIVRVETNTPQFGKQVYIRHMSLNKAYLLIDYNGEHYAIQTSLDEQKKKDTSDAKYNYKKTFKFKKIVGVKARKVMVTALTSKRVFEAYFTKKMSNKYLEVFTDFPGLAVDYYLASEEALLHYVLIEKKEFQPSRDLFGLPSDYKRISFDEFVRKAASK